MADTEKVIGFAGLTQLLAGFIFFVFCAGFIPGIPKYPLLSFVVGLHAWVSKSCLL